ncbi:MAG TPA: cell division protein ZapA [Limnochordia bacterium]|nr:cell division protein ZapA [Limnochordia bacterium]
MAAERPGADASWVKVRVRIDGDELTIRGKGPESYVIELANMVNSRIEEIRRSHPNLARHHAAILAAMYLADEAYRLRQENRELTQILEEVR